MNNKKKSNDANKKSDGYQASTQSRMFEIKNVISILTTLLPA